LSRQIVPDVSRDRSEDVEWFVTSRNLGWRGGGAVAASANSTATAAAAAARSVMDYIDA